MKNSSDKILIAIPNATLRELLGEVLELHDYGYVSCGNEQSTLLALETHTFSTGIFEWELSNKTFPDIFKKIQNIQPEMKILILAVQIELEILNHIQNDVFCTYLKVPIDLESFENSLSECVKQYNASKNHT